MKKFLISVILAALTAASVMAQDAQAAKPVWDHGDNVSDLSYQNVFIYKVLDHKDAYIVMYAKQGMKVGTTIVPKSWSAQTPRKLDIRNKPKGLSPYMTVIKKNGEFLLVRMTLPLNRNDPVCADQDFGTIVVPTFIPCFAYMTIYASLWSRTL